MFSEHSFASGRCAPTPARRHDNKLGGRRAGGKRGWPVVIALRIAGGWNVEGGGSGWAFPTFALRLPASSSRGLDSASGWFGPASGPLGLARPSSARDLAGFYGPLSGRRDKSLTRQPFCIVLSHYGLSLAASAVWRGVCPLWFSRPNEDFQ